MNIIDNDNNTSNNNDNNNHNSSKSNSNVNNSSLIHDNVNSTDNNHSNPNNDNDNNDDDNDDSNNVRATGGSGPSWSSPWSTSWAPPRSRAAPPWAGGRRGPRRRWCHGGTGSGFLRESTEFTGRLPGECSLGILRSGFPLAGADLGRDRRHQALRLLLRRGPAAGGRRRGPRPLLLHVLPGHQYYYNYCYYYYY